MYSISQLASLTGLSRTALLYYEKLGLIQGARLNNGYRSYHNRDLQRVRLIQQLQAGGLTLKECKQCLEAKLDRQLLSQRLAELEQQIATKQQAKALLQGLLGERDLQQFHQQLDAIAPEAHLQWLQTQGFDEKAALHLKWLSKDMNQHDQYMADFMHVFSTLECWGPGDKAATLQALSKVPHEPKQLLEIGCGKGLATLALAEATQAQLTALDNEQSALDALAVRFDEQQLAGRLNTVCASMTELPFAANSFDLIWSEGSAYIMGVEAALQQWQPLLQQDGVLVLSDLVWLVDSPAQAAKAFWSNDYPAMTTVAERLTQIEQAGYQLLDTFTLSRQAWDNYSVPLTARVAELQGCMPDSQAIKDIKHELQIYADHLGEFGYQMFVMQKR
ncbi:methyltransferase domain-containing protein [Ferrimonas senticii]|uniref:methyltransferase domain-containing protein n=1 Tax=Ferrimonas senticii TaxID=394566 RepID=UPI00040690C0|nr:methyltransferase domain-containing protein [Ferrimonas senticii]